MSEFRHLSDNELSELLKEKLLASDGTDKVAEEMLDLQAEAVFGKEPVALPPAAKEQQLFSKLGVKAASKFSASWVFTSLSVATAIIVTTVALIVNSNASENRSVSTNSKPIAQNAMVLPVNLPVTETEEHKTS